MSAVALAAGLWLAAGAADTVLLLRSDDPARAAFEERVAAELYASGFQVHNAAGSIEAAGDIPGQLWAICQKAGARGVMWIALRGDGQVDAWVAVPETSKAVVRTWAAPATYAERATLALKAVELLHATFLETGVIEPEDPDLPPLIRFRQPFRRAWTFGTGVGAIFTPGGFRPEPLLELQVGYDLRKNVSLDLTVAASLWPVRVATMGGAFADIGLVFLRLLGLWTPLRAGPFSFSLAAGTGLMMLWISGQISVDPLDPPSADVRVGWLLSGGAAVTYHFFDEVRLQLLGTVGVTVPQLTAYVAQVPVGNVGLPLYDVLLRLQFE
jgi:hypothetical protein